MALRLADRAGLTWSEERDIPVRSVVAEFAAAARVHNRTMGKQMSDAFALVEQFLTVWEAFHTGRERDRQPT